MFEHRKRKQRWAVTDEEEGGHKATETFGLLVTSLTDDGLKLPIATVKQTLKLKFRLKAEQREFVRELGPNYVFVEGNFKIYIKCKKQVLPTPIITRLYSSAE